MSFDYESPFGDGCKELSYFEQIGKQVAKEAGVEPINSVFYTSECGEYGNDFYSGLIDYQKLIEFLNNSNLVECFDWRDFISTNVKHEYKNPETINSGLPLGSEYTPINNPYQLKVQDHTQNIEFDLGELNKHVCYIHKDPSYGYNLDLGDKKYTLKELSFYIKFYYNNTEQYRTQIRKLENTGVQKYKISTKYTAIKLTTSEPAVFSYIGALLAPHEEHVLLTIQKEAFRKAYKIISEKDRRNIEEINWFYSKVPQILISEMSVTDLWRDLRSLLEYDKRYGFRDNSQNILKLIGGMFAIDGGIVYLYHKLKDNAPFIKEMHLYISDEVAYIDSKGEKYTYQDLFADLLAAVSLEYYRSLDIPMHPYPFFVIGPNYRVNSDIFYADEYEDLYKIWQEEYQESDVDAYGTEYLPEYDYWATKGKVHYKHPLDLVTLIEVDEDGNILSQEIVPAIVVKNIAYKNEWARVDTTIRIIGDILAVVGGIAGLFTGNPFLIGLAIGDIAVGVADLLFLAGRDTIKKMEGGQEFIDTWDEIYSYASLFLAVTSFPNTVRSILKTGGNLLKIGKAADNVDEVVSVLDGVKEIVLEINKTQYPERSFQSVEMGAKAFGKIFSDTDMLALNRLEESGVILARLDDAEGGKSFSAFYEGKIIAPSSSAEEFRRILKRVWYSNKIDMTNKLKRLKKTITYLKITDYPDILSTKDIQKIATSIRRHPLLRDFDIVNVGNSNKAYASLIEEWTKHPTYGFFMPKTGIHPKYKIALKGPRVYLFDDLIKDVDIATLPYVPYSKYNLQHYLSQVESMTYLKDAFVVGKEVTKKIPTYMHVAYALSEYVKSTLTYGNTIGLLTDLNVLNSLISNYVGITGKQISEMTINDLKSWELTDELIELNIIPE